MLLREERTTYYTIATVAKMVEKIAEVTFDVGGKIYQVSRTLVEAFPETMLYAPASDRWTNGCIDPIFIDRNGERFQYLLDYMRDNEVHLPWSIPKQALSNDFTYYGFQVDTNRIKCAAVHPSHVADQLKSWEKKHLDKAQELRMVARTIQLEGNCAEFCYALLRHHLMTKELYMDLENVRN